MTCAYVARMLALGFMTAASVSSHANAAISISESMTALPDAAAFTLFALPDADRGDQPFTFGTISFRFVYSNTGDSEGVVHGSGPGYAAPVSDTNGTQYAGNYLSSGTGSITLSFATAQSQIGLLWGSVDAGNEVAFYENGTLVGSVDGTDVSVTANGSQDYGGSEYVRMFSNRVFDTVVLSSTQPSFEAALYVATPATGNATSASVPEPSSVLLLAIAMIGLVLARRAPRILCAIRAARRT